MAKLINDKWLGEEEGMLFLEPRAIMELEPYFQNEYEDYLRKCSLCNSYVFHGKDCNNCDLKIHKHCFDRYYTGQEMTCPSCSNSFLNGNNDNEMPQSQAIPTSRNKRKRQHE